MVEALGGRLTFQEGLGQDACRWLEEGLEAQGSALLPPLSSSVPQTDPGPGQPPEATAGPAPTRPDLLGCLRPLPPQEGRGNLTRDPHKNRCISG